MPLANVTSDYRNGNLVFKHADGTVVGQIGVGQVPITKRVRATIAAVNAGTELLPALPGFKYRMIEALAISIGGAAGAVTTVDVIGTQSTAVKLVAYAQAALTQSAVLKAGGANAAVLADGASYVACDANTAITAGVTGDPITTATHIDFILTFAIDAG